MNKTIFKFSTIILASIILCVSSVYADGKIKKIVVQGNKRIETSTIKEYIALDAGDRYSADSKSSAIKKLYATSLFENINISFSNGTLRVKVQETPLITKVVFKGNSKVKSSILANEVYSSVGESLKKARVHADAEKIKEIYKRAGRFAVIVNPKIEQQENNRAKVIFEIIEGPKTGIKRIYFAGNENYSDSELKSVVMTKESKWFRFLETNDTYDPDRIEYDKYLLKRFYNSVGFADFRVISVTADLLPTKEGFIVTYSIEEGDKYKFGDIRLANKLSTIEDKEILHFLPKNKKGEIFNMQAMQNISEKIANNLAGLGYPQVDCYPTTQKHEQEKVIDVVMVVDDADKVFINQINIEGNLKTQDNVIRNQFKIAEGDVFNRNKIDQGEKNIRNLDYFEKVKVKIVPTENRDRYDVKIDVQEKSTSSIGLDLGYNTSGGMFGRISFLEKNLIGTGKYLNAGVKVGRRSTSYYLGVTDPNFLERDLTLGGSIFRSENGRGSGLSNRGEQNYSLKSMGARISLGYDVTDDLFHEIEYSIKQDKLKASTTSNSRFITEQMGKFVTSSIGHSLTYDKTDSRILPKNGYLINAEQEFAGLGGNTKYLKHELTGKYFKSFAENKYTLKLSASGGDIRGVGGKKVRISDVFNLGEQRLRGFAHGGVGPRDKATNEGFGGKKYYTTSVELSFPLGLPAEYNITGSIFADAGSLWDVDSKATTTKGIHNDRAIRASVGAGVLWMTRIAPIRIDWAFPVKKQRYDETQNFHIQFSTNF